MAKIWAVSCCIGHETCEPPTWIVSRTPIKLRKNRPPSQKKHKQQALPSAIDVTNLHYLAPQTMAEPFTPIRTKSSASRKQCICGWGDLCAQFTTFFQQQKHPLAGVVRVNYTNLCDSQNFLRGAIGFLGVEKCIIDELKQKHEAYSEDQSKPIPVISVSKFHFPLDLVELKRGWTQPLTSEDIEQLESYTKRSPPPNMDTKIKYNPTLGKGQSERSKKKYKETKLYRAVPFVPVNDVISIVVGIQNNSDNTTKPTRNRLDMDVIRSTAEELRLREEKEMAEYEWESRDVDDWREYDIKQASAMKSKEDENEALKDEIRSLKRILETREDEMRDLNNMYESANSQRRQHIQKKRKQVERAKSSCEAEVTESALNEADKKLCEAMRVLFSNDGGLSRLTLFNDEWHQNHPDAARQLWGYHSWEETKLYVAAYFPDLETGYDPSKHVKLSKDSLSFELPNITPFEACLIIRMFFHRFSHQQVVGLLINRDRSRVGQMLRDWAPRWANVGMDLSILDITADYLRKDF
eukprot:scaffold38305_cov62-Cyclotella_meneghiniana.AAC.5